MQIKQPTEAKGFAAIKRYNASERDSMALLPIGVWSLLFDRLTWADGAKLAQAARGANERWCHYQFNSQSGCHRVLTSRHIISQDVFDSAISQGIEVDYILLLRLHRIAYYMVENLATLPPEEIWSIAAICGDQKWLVHNVSKDQLEHLVDFNGISVFDYLAFGGHIADLKTLYEYYYISENALNMHYDSILEYAALGGHEGSLIKLNGTKNKICLPKLLQGGHLALALKLFKYEIMEAKITKKSHMLSLGAAQHGHFNVCDYFEQQVGASPFEKHPEWGFSQLHFAARFNDLPRVKKLQRCLDKKMPTDKDGKSPLHYAALGGAAATLEYLIQTFPESARSVILDNTNPFSLAVTRGHVERVVKLAAKCHFNLKLIDRRGQTLLFSAAVAGDWPEFVYLRDQLGIANQPNVVGTTPLMTAFINARARFITHYVNGYGKKVLDEKDNFGNGIGYYILMIGNLTKAKYFLNKYAVDLNSPNLAGRCPLFALASADQTYVPFIASVAKEFALKLADDWYDRPDQKGETFKQLIMANGQQELFPQFFNKVTGNNFTF